LEDMLITHVRPSELWGKKVYDAEGRYLGAVVAIGSRRGVVRKVVVQRERNGAQVRLMPPAGTHEEGSNLVLPASGSTTPAQLHIVR
jgi:sporulation protein YlmC with PRC-barrel domain